MSNSGGSAFIFMPQLYARIFLQILDSSLAEDYQTRHVFEDLLKLCNQDGVVDMTREAISRRTNIPLEIVNRAIEKLEGPDPHSRDPEDSGRRLVRLDDHRDWGWRIVNHQKYESIRVNNDMREWNATRMAHYRSNKKKRPSTLPKESTPPSPEGNPTSSEHVVLHVAHNYTLQDVKNAARAIALPDSQCEAFFHHYNSQDWIKGNGQRITNINSMLSQWKANWQAGLKVPPKPKEPSVYDCL